MGGRVSLQAPDYVAPTIGWRVWNVVDVDGALRLSSLLYHAHWSPQEEVAATCRRSLAYLPWGRMPIHTAPASDCVCGIYGATHSEQARPFLWAPGTDSASYRVLGRVALWGRVVQARAGWRAEFGYPDRLYVAARNRYARQGWRRRRLRPADVARELAAYRVPVEVVDSVPMSADSTVRPTA